MASEIRVNSIKNRSGLSTVTWNDEGIEVVGIATALELDVSGNATIGGDLGVAGTLTYEDVARVDAVGLSTYREGLHIGPLAGIAATVYKDGSIRTTGVITATTYYGSGANLTGISADSTKIETGNTKVETIDTGSDGHVKITTEGSERLRIDSAGRIGINVTSPNTELEIQAATDPKIRLESKESGSQRLDLWIDGGTAIGYIAADQSASQLAFKTAGSERLRIDASGNVLIGTTTANSELTVKGGGTVAAFEGTGGNGSIMVTDVDNSKNLFLQNANGVFNVQTSGSSYSNKFSVDESGKIYCGSGASNTYGSNSRDLNVGRRTGTPNATFALAGGEGIGGGTGPYMEMIHGPDGGTQRVHQIYSYVGNFWITPDNASSFNIGTAPSGQDFIIDTSGHVTKPNQPSFAAYQNQSSWTVAGDTTLVFNSTRHNVGNHYSTSTGRFTAPVAGNYLFTFFTIMTGNYSSAYIRYYKNGARVYGGDNHFTTNNWNSGQWHNVSFSNIFNLAANDYIEIRNGSTQVTYHGHHWQIFCGYLLG